MLRDHVENRYKSIIEKLDCAELVQSERVSAIIKEGLKQFMYRHSQVAIYGNGEHTRMLMVDYVYELKNIKYIIDNHGKRSEDTGYKIIAEDQLEELKIDGVIISSTKYRKEMVENLRERHPQIAYLDLYEELEEQGIYLNTPYYRYWYPANHYLEICKLREKLQKSANKEEKEKSGMLLLKKYVALKDFRLAVLLMEQMGMVNSSRKNQTIYDEIKELYQLQLQAVAEVCEDNVLMMCVDGLRRKDYVAGLLPQMKEYCDRNMTFFTNAYACSTSTYESLVPAYGENDDLRTRYFDSNEIEEKNCRFIQEAKRQGRNIYFYTDSAAYVTCDAIQRNNNYLTVTEKLWYFLLDAVEEKNGLFYIHIGYESHFPYVNPYTLNLVADGSNIMFDYLDRLGGKIRTDYEQQQHDSLRYLDDTLAPFLNQLKLRTVLFADHGNILLSQEEKLGEIEAGKYSYHEDLIQIPLAVKMPEMNGGQNNQLISLMALNEIIICLLNKTKFAAPTREFIKVERSAVYNPDFQYLYRKAGKERELQAFEVFIFRSGYKLAVYESGETEVFMIPGDEPIENEKLVWELLCKIRDYITVCKVGDSI